MMYISKSKFQIAILINLIILGIAGFIFLKAPTKTTTITKSENIIAPNTKANISYQKANDICDGHIFDIQWQDFEMGKIQSVYCNNR